ncbi:hypothetical protein UJ101_02083 [Flavobacteriaceae bacterium UJ101]|nr:hypothetical protein UJ101_02083 [Flavobacteriaceae bacterium UJ101]
MRERIFYTLILVLISHCALSQVGIGTTTPNSSSILDLKSTGGKGAIVLPYIQLQSSVTNPTEGMIAYSENEQGLTGYQSRNYLRPKWSSIFLTGDALQIQTDITTGADWQRNLTTNTDIAIPGMEKTIFPTVNSSYISAEFKTDVEFTQNCFRGRLVIKVFDGSNNELASESNTFNFQGSSLQQTLPVNVNVNYISTAGETIRIKAYHNATSTACKLAGRLTNNELIINYY